MELWSMPNTGVFVATRVLHNEEALLDYRMSNLKWRRMIYSNVWRGPKEMELRVCWLAIILLHTFSP